MAYLERKYPDPPLFGSTPEDAGTVMRVISEYQAYTEEHLNKLIALVFFEGLEGRMDEATKSVKAIAKEARTIESRLTASSWLMGDSFSAADAVIFPGVQLLLRALERREAQDLRGHFAPLDAHFPAIAAWVRRVENLPGFDRTYPPHWRG